MQSVCYLTMDELKEMTRDLDDPSEILGRIDDVLHPMSDGPIYADFEFDAEGAVYSMLIINYHDVPSTQRLMLNSHHSMPVRGGGVQDGLPKRHRKLPS